MYGKEFWVTFSENILPDTFNHLLVTPTVADVIRVYNPQLGQAAVFNVKPGIQNIIRVPNTSLTFWYSAFTGSASNTGVQVTSTNGPFALQAVNTVSGSTDITAVLPVEALESAYEYLIHAAAGNPGKESQAAILAIDAGTTTIEITAGCDIDGLVGKGGKITRNLKQGQVFVFRALDTQNLTGSMVRVKGSCKRIAAFAGTKCARVPDKNGCNGCDVLFEQLYPTWALGKDYFIPPVPDNKTWYVGVAALFDNTSVSVNGNPLAVLNKGDWQYYDANAGVLLTADKPVSCMQMLKSSGCNGAASGSLGDPSYSIIPALSSTVKLAATSVYRNPAYNSSKVVVSATGSSAPVIKVNGVAIPSGAYQSVTISGITFWYATQNVTYNQTWTFQSDMGFQAFQYGQGSFESYASCIAASFPNREADLSATPSLICDPQSPVTFTASGDSLGTVKWYFGDGDTSLANPAQHIYGTPGVYKASLLNKALAICPDSVQLTVVVRQGPGKLLPPDSIACAGITYRLELPTGKPWTYLWDNGSNSAFRSLNSNKTVWLKVTDTFGCVDYDTLTLAFTNCNLNDLKLSNVFTPDGDGINDTWKVYFKAYIKIDVTIYNRWGEVVYAYNLPAEEDWNGKVDNHFIECPSGAYFYRLIATEGNGKTRTVNGVIELIR